MKRKTRRTPQQMSRKSSDEDMVKMIAKAVKEAMSEESEPDDGEDEKAMKAIKNLVKEAGETEDVGGSDIVEALEEILGESKDDSDIAEVIAEIIESQKSRKDEAGDEYDEAADAEEILSALSELAEDKADDDDEDESKGDDDDEGKNRKSMSYKTRARKARANKPVQRKYANFFMRKGDEKVEVKKLPPGIGFARAVKCMTIGKSDPERAAYTAKKMYQDTRMEREFKALSATNPVGGGYFIPENYANEIIPLLYNKAVIPLLGATRVPMENGNINIPKMNSGSRARYIGENRPIPKTKPTDGNIKLSSKKLAAMVPISNDLLRSSAFTADQMFMQDLLTQMSLAMDYTGLYGKGTDFQPLGVANAKGIQKMSNLGELNADTPADMLAKLLTVNPPELSIGWTFNTMVWSKFYNLKTTTGAYIYREEMNIGKLLGYPFVRTNQIPTAVNPKKTSEIFLGDWSEFMIGEQAAFEVESAREGAYTNESGELVSVFENDQTLVRVIGLHDFGLRHDETFVVGEGAHTA